MRMTEHNAFAVCSFRIFPSIHELSTIPLARKNSPLARKNSPLLRLQVSYCWYATALNPIMFPDEVTVPKVVAGSMPVINGHYGLTQNTTYPLIITFKASLYGKQLCVGAWEHCIGYSVVCYCCSCSLPLVWHFS